MEMDPAHQQSSSSSSSHASHTSTIHASSTISSHTSPKLEKPIFTLKQMTMIAERMCKVCRFMIAGIRHYKKGMLIQFVLGKFTSICGYGTSSVRTVS